MAAPSKNFTVISDSAIDADSPLTEDLMTDLRDNDIHLEEWLGLSYTAAQDHNHDGVNSAFVASAGGAHKPNDTTITNDNTLSNDDDLFFPVLKDGVYIFTAALFVQQAAGIADFQWKFTGASGLYTYTLIENTAQDIVESALAQTGIGFDVEMPMDSLQWILQMQGTVTASADGNFQLQWAQLNSHSSATTLRSSSSYLTFVKIV